jgi:6-phosphofructokinase
MLRKKLSHLFAQRKDHRKLVRTRLLSMESLDQRITFDVNQAPVNTIPGPQTFTNGDPTVTFGTANRVSTHDADANGLDLRVTLFVNDGKITLGSTAGLTFLNGADDTRYLLFDGTEADINNALLSMKYTANAGATSDVLTFDVHDLGHTGTGGAQTDRDTISLTRAVAVNQPPVNTVPGPRTYGSDRTVTFSGSSSISTQDPDAGNLDLRMTLFVNEGTIRLASTAGLIFRSGANNTSYLLFDGTQDEINSALQGLQYRANPGVTSDTLTVDTHDLGHTGSGGARTDRDLIAMTQVGVFPNQPPVNTVPGPQVYNSSSRTVTFSGANRVSTHDADAGGQDLRVTLFVNNGRINLPTTAGLIFRSGADNTRYMVFDGTETEVNNAMNNMVYTANAGATSDTFTIDTHDLGHTGSGGAKTDRDSVSLNQVGVLPNQAPVNTVPGPQIYTNSNRTVAFGSANRISTNDPDVGGEELRVTLFVDSGRINLSTTAGLEFLDGGDDTRYLLFDGTQAEVNNAMLNMTYTADVGAASDVLTVDVHDLGHTGSGGAKTDRDTVFLTRVGLAGRSSGGGSGEPSGFSQSSRTSSSAPPIESTDSVFAELTPVNPSASAIAFLDLLASSNLGRSKVVKK